jgi:ferredoxin
MPKITFLPQNKTFEVCEGTTLLDAAVENGLPLVYSCKIGRCITDLVAIIKGAENLSFPDPDEENTLEIMGSENMRLACVAKILRGEVVVDISEAMEKCGKLL